MHQQETATTIAAGIAAAAATVNIGVVHLAKLAIAAMNSSAGRCSLYYRGSCLNRCVCPTWYSYGRSSSNVTRRLPLATEINTLHVGRASGSFPAQATMGLVPLADLDPPAIRTRYSYSTHVCADTTGRSELLEPCTGLFPAESTLVVLDMFAWGFGPKLETTKYSNNIDLSDSTNKKRTPPLSGPSNCRVVRWLPSVFRRPLQASVLPTSPVLWCCAVWSRSSHCYVRRLKYRLIVIPL